MPARQSQPPETSNERIRHAAITRQVDLLRFGNGLGDRMVRTLNRDEPRLRAQLLALLGAGLVSPARQRRAIAKYKKVLEASPSFSEVQQAGRAELMKLARDEVAFTGDLVEGALPVELELARPHGRSLTEGTLAAAFLGLTYAAWIQKNRRDDRDRLIRELTIGASFKESSQQISRRLFGTRALRGSDGARETTRRGLRALGVSAANHVSTAARSLLAGANPRIMRLELFVAVLDAATTAICRSLDGRTFNVGEGPHPPLHHRCRSIRVPIVDAGAVSGRTPKPGELAGFAGQRRRIEAALQIGKVPGGITYGSWLRSMPAKAQDTILGSVRGPLFRRGGLDLGAFVDASGKQLNIQQLADRVPEAFGAANVPLPTT